MYQVLLTIQYISIVLLMIMSGYIIANWKTRLQGVLFFYCVSTLVNNVGYLIKMTSATENEYFIGVIIHYLGTVWIPFSLFWLVLTLVRVRISKHAMYILAVFHGITFFLVMTSKYHPIYYSAMVFVEKGLFPHLEFEHGPWYFLNAVAVVAYILFGLYLLLKHFQKEHSKSIRVQMRFLAGSIAIFSMFYFIKLLGVMGCYDASILGYNIGCIPLCIALFKYDLLDILQMTRDYVVDELAEAVFVIDADGNVEYYNKPAQAIFPLIAEDPKGVYLQVNRAVEEHKLLELDGRMYSPQIRSTKEMGNTKEKIYVLVDCTEQFRHMEDLQAQRDIAERASLSKSEFISMVSHEIRTPMNAIVGMTDLILREEDGLTKKQLKYLRNIKNSGIALVMLVNDLLDQSKIEAGKMEIVEGPYALRPLLSDIRMIIENRIGNKPIQLLEDIDDNIPKYLMGDSLRIRQILINLMNNAAKFTEEGFIKLSVREINSDAKKMAIRFSIQDSGQGIRQEDLNKLGQAFSQVNIERNYAKEGTGLGLAISKNFIQLMGGKLEVKSVFGEGSEFSFTILQGTITDEERLSLVGIAKETWSEKGFACPGARILLVDDNEVNLMVLGELLEPYKMHVDTAESGEQALEMVEKNTYHLVFMDYLMPFMDGAETAKRIRQRAETAETYGDEGRGEYFKTLPIIAFSGEVSEETKEIFREAGMNDITEKPVDMEDIKEKLKKWLPAEFVKSNE